MQYRFGTHRDVPDLVPQLTRLTNSAFREYEGAMPVGEGFTVWYLQRPGCSPDLCPVALAGEELVANVLVTIQQVRLGPDLLPCAIVDTVATAPGHRRRGLARRLMDDAHRLMRDAGAEAALLYTNPRGHPYGFYQRLGYQLRAQGEALVGWRPPGDAAPPEPASAADAPAIRSLVDAHYADHEGYAPFTDALWRWRRVARPAELPCQVVVLRNRGGEVSATAAFSPVDILMREERVRLSVLSDAAWTGPASAALPRLLSAAPTEQVLALADTKAPLYAALRALEFQPAVAEAALVLPWSPRARDALEQDPEPWSIMVESVVGV